jgi:hypothetical protein
MEKWRMCCEICSNTVNILEKKYNAILKHIFKRKLGGVGAICKKCAEIDMSAVCSEENGEIIFLEDVICETPQGCKVIFQNGNPLDCRRENLTVCIIG